MSSVFLAIPRSEWIAENALAFAVRDRYPVSEGHTLVIPRREIETWWEASADERSALLALVDDVKARLDAALRPDGFNVGFNAGEAAGQTVPHLHLHVIPRWDGDVADPRGGVRHVIPGRGNYLLPDAAGGARGGPSDADAALVDARDGRFMRRELSRCLASRAFDRIDLVVSFVMKSGLELIAGGLVDAVERGAAVRVLTTDYLHVTDADALAWLLDRSEEATTLRGSFEAKVFSDPVTSFHPKAYLFWSSGTTMARGFVGSSNLSRSGIDGGVEWNVGLSALGLLRQSFDALWEDRRAVPVSHRLVRSYRESTPPLAQVTAIAGVIAEPPAQPVEPRAIQRLALNALEETRSDGYDAGLVVMATGLGKTWLAAFDSARPQVRRTLFIAHREEILRQSRDVFRQVQPGAELGLFMGADRQPDADVVLASIQTLARNLDAFRADEFDYVVVDEFHHAAAASYRRAIAYFEPSFLLGLTATPERLDGADLLGLCGDNLVFECGLVEGIERGDLVPFEYWGVRDTVDYAPIPWRNGRFDDNALTEAVATRERAAQVLEEWRAKGRGPTIAFCASVTHADFTSAFFTEHGLRAVSVHSGPTSAPRIESVAALAASEIDILCTVDVFNEGVDIPVIETVLMLRPTKSPVVFLQQLGRGLRPAAGKSHLRVIDFIGNHRSFLFKPRLLLGLGGILTPSPKAILDLLGGETEPPMPEGCAVHFDLELVDLLRTYLGARAGSVLVGLCKALAAETGDRPTALQAFRAGANPASTRQHYGHWFGMLAAEDLLDEDERRVFDLHGDVLRRIETEPATKAYKLVTLKALLQDGALHDGEPIGAVAARAHRLIAGDPRLVADVEGKEMPDPRTADPARWAAYWRKWPLEHLANDKGGAALFRVDRDRFRPAFAVQPQDRAVFDAMVAELVDWRLAAYLLRQDAKGAIRMRVSHNDVGPILFLDRNRYPQAPDGETAVDIEGEWWVLRFVKVAVNVGRPAGADERTNELRVPLERWFGDDAGAPGTNHHVLLERLDDEWNLRPERPGPEQADVTVLDRSG